MSCNKDKPYLADVQVGDKLYNFLEDNKEYVVVHISKEYEEITIRLSDLPQGAKDPRYFELVINPDGTMERGFTVPHFLYAPVRILDPNNLPPRPWKPKKGEWVWARVSGILNENAPWKLVRFDKETTDSKYLCYAQFGEEMSGTYHEIAPFKGELPPGLEEENE